MFINEDLYEICSVTVAAHQAHDEMLSTRPLLDLAVLRPSPLPQCPWASCVSAASSSHGHGSAAPARGHGPLYRVTQVKGQPVILNHIIYHSKYRFGFLGLSFSDVYNGIIASNVASLSPKGSGGIPDTSL